MGRQSASVATVAAAWLAASVGAAEIAWVPVRSTGPFTLAPNEILLPNGGVDVTLEIHLSGWDDDLDGVPKLRAFQATVDPSSYSSGPGSPLAPLTIPHPGAGAFQSQRICIDLPDLDPTGNRCDPPLVCPGDELCIENHDWVFDGIESIPLLSTDSPDYSWGGLASQPCATDDGTPKYAGTLILTVPEQAFGTYTIGFNSDPEATYLQDCPFHSIWNPILTPGKITIVTGACCDGDQCLDTTQRLCEASPTGYWIKNYPKCPGNLLCETGSCCLGPGMCDDSHRADTRPECDELGGKFLGRARCAVLPCPVCDVTDDVQCKRPGGTEFFASDAAAGNRVADDFRPDGDAISHICWHGLYVSDGAPAEGYEDCSWNYDDDFWITVYRDAGGFPDEISDPLFEQGVTPYQDVVGTLDLIRVFEYSATLPEPVPVAPGECYWLEIENDRGVDDGCYWRWLSSSEAYNRFSAHDTDGEWASEDSIIPHDFSFCLDVALDEEDCGELPGACCTSPARCTDTSLSVCEELDGVWHMGASCEEFDCPRPTGACCVPTIGTCIDEVADEQCLLPLQWVEGASCAAVTCALSTEMAWVPVASTGPSVFDEARNEIILPVGGVEVTLELRISGWDPDMNGQPQLGAFQATLAPSSFTSGEGAPLEVFADPDPSAGAFQITKTCLDAQTAMPTGNNCDTPLVCPVGEICVPAPDWVFSPFPTVKTVTLGPGPYSWLAVIQIANCKKDGGEAKYAGTLIITVPPGAKGTYTIGFNEDSDDTFLNDCDSLQMSDITLSPAFVTIETGKCCYLAASDGLGAPAPACAVGVTRYECATFGEVLAFEPNGLLCTGAPGECNPGCLTIVSSDPPDGAVDARQPFDVDGMHPSGWQTIDLTVDGEVSAVTAADISITREGGLDPAPTVASVSVGPAGRVRVHLDKPLGRGTRTTFTYNCSQSSVRFGYLPGDVDGDGTVHPFDVLLLIDALSGAVELPIWSSDIDRDGVLMPRDLLREIDLLNGAGAYREWLGGRLP